MSGPKVDALALEALGFDPEHDDQPVVGVLEALAQDLQTFADSLPAGDANGPLIQRVERWAARARLASALAEKVVPLTGGAS